MVSVNKDSCFVLTFSNFKVGLIPTFLQKESAKKGPTPKIRVRACFIVLFSQSLKRDYSQHVTGGVYKAKVHIHRSVLIYDY